MFTLTLTNKMNTVHQLYSSMGVEADDVRSFARDPVFVELCSGTKSMSVQALRMGFKTVVTLDRENDYSPDYCCDIMDVDGDHPFLKKMNDFVKEGRVIVMHASPPCNEFSRMNTTGVRDIARAIAIVKKCVTIMKSFTNVWTLENPRTGCLWEQPFAQNTFNHFHDFDYCRYGGIMRKATRIVFSSQTFKDSIVPLICTSRNSCMSCYVDPQTNRLRHTNMTELPYEERIAIPSQLCVVLLSSFRARAMEEATTLADALVAFAHEPDADTSWYELDKILDSRGTGRCVEYFISWKGYGEEENMWVASKHICKVAKKQYQKKCKQYQKELKQVKDIMILKKMRKTMRNELQKKLIINE
jgi:hypothetical protein